MGWLSSGLVKPAGTPWLLYIYTNSLSWGCLHLSWISGISFFTINLCSLLPFSLRILCFPCARSLWLLRRVTGFLCGNSSLLRALGTGAAGHFKCVSLELTSWWFHCIMQFKASHWPGLEWRRGWYWRGAWVKRSTAQEQRPLRQQNSGNSIGIAKWKKRLWIWKRVRRGI